MSVTLDGQALFDEQQMKIEVGSFRRDSIERTVPGLNGMLSIDLGKRDREIRQEGTLRTASRSQMNERINAISGYMDGNTHTLVTSSGEEFDSLRMNVFQVKEERASGTGVTIDYEIVYTQLVV